VAADQGAGRRGPGVEADVFRRALAQLAGGVVVVTTADAEGEPAGVTVTAVCSVSLEPPLVLVCLGAGSRTRELIASSGRYAISVLGSGHRSHSERFAEAGDGKFDGVTWEAGKFGCPILTGSIAVCECELEQSIDAGDHTILIGRVVEATAASGPGELPLLWYRGSYGRLSEEDGS
jgi:flavin reductase (DIM6/NTAB) family NADH-FMN oxidoreductase RutF